MHVENTFFMFVFKSSMAKMPRDGNGYGVFFAEENIYSLKVFLKIKILTLKERR